MVIGSHSSSSSSFSSLSQPSQIVCLHKPRLHYTTGCQTGLYNRFDNRLYTRYNRLSNRFDNMLYRVNGALEFSSEMCCARLAGNTAPKKSPKIRHLGTIAQLCRAISSQVRHVSTIGKCVKQQRLPHMSSQYGELWPTSGEICWRVWGTPVNFNGFRILAWVD